MVIDGQMRLVLPVGLAVDIDGSRRVVVLVGVVHLLDSCRWVRLHNLPALAVVQLHPVVLAVFDLASALERLGEQLTQVVVVGGVLKTKVADVAKVLVELLCSELALMISERIMKRTREGVAEILDGRGLLLLANLLVLLLVGSRLKALPWQSTTEEVHENVTEGLEIVSAGLLASQVGVDTHVTSSTRKRLALPVRDVLLRLGITVLLGHTEVDNVDHVGALGARAPDEEVVGLDVPIDEVLLVDGLDSRQLGR
jgi:hypothetical protein